MTSPTRLIVFGGLPGTGKTTLSRQLAKSLGAVWLRIDAIEQAMRDAGIGTVGLGGYAAAQAVAEANLRLGLSVVADCVDPVAASRAGWRDVATRSGAAILQIELVCSDPAEHRRRVEARVADISGFRLPRWDDVVGHDYEPWHEERLILDTLQPPENLLLEIEATMTALCAGPPRGPT